MMPCFAENWESDLCICVHGGESERRCLKPSPTTILAAIAVNSTSASAADDERIVAALDTQYQEAVKKNDAATMDRILADDFVLVIGSGGTYTKADLLQEARSRRVL